jgi:hypothetical protein
MKYKMEKAAIYLFNMLLSGNESQEIIHKIFKILKNLKEFNESFLHLVLPSFCQIINDYSEAGDDYFIQEIISYIRAMLEYDPSKNTYYLYQFNNNLVV